MSGDLRAALAAAIGPTLGWPLTDAAVDAVLAVVEIEVAAAFSDGHLAGITEHLAAVDEAKAQAWDEGYDAGVRSALGRGTPRDSLSPYAVPADDPVHSGAPGTAARCGFAHDGRTPCDNPKGHCWQAGDPEPHLRPDGSPLRPEAGRQ